MIPQYELKAEDVSHYAIEKMKEYIPVEAHGYCCTTEMILDVLLKASVECSSIEANCADLEDVADSNLIREYLNQAIEVKTLREREKQIKAALASCIPEALERTGIESAIDFHDEPFYGKGKQTRQVTVRGQAKKGTTYFVRIATAHVIWRQVRLTLAVCFVLPGETALETLQFLLECLKQLYFSSKVLYLDKGFASTPIIRFLEKQKQPAILTCPIRCKTKGIRTLCRGSASFRTVHSFTVVPRRPRLESFSRPGQDRPTMSQMAGFHWLFASIGRSRRSIGNIVAASESNALTEWCAACVPPRFLVIQPCDFSCSTSVCSC